MPQNLLGLDYFKCKSLEGEWWEPDQPDNKFEGTLYIEKNNHGKLTIRGYSSVLFKLSLRIIQSPLGAIFGHLTTQNKYKITLFNPVISRGASHCEDRDLKTDVLFFTNHIIIGEHVASEDDQIVNRALLSVTWLEEWYDKTGFSGNVSSYLRTEKVDLLYQANHSPFYTVAAERLLRVISHYSGPLFFDGIKNFKVREYNLI